MLDAWSRASRTSYHPCCRDQVGRPAVARVPPLRDRPQLQRRLVRAHAHPRDGLDHTDEIRCDNGALVYPVGGRSVAAHAHQRALTVESGAPSHISPRSVRMAAAAVRSRARSTPHSGWTRAAPAARSSPSHPPSPPLSAAEQRTPCIADGLRQTEQLEALLGHLNGMDYGPSKGSVVSASASTSRRTARRRTSAASRNATVEVARTFAQGGGFVGGRVEPSPVRRTAGWCAAGSTRGPRPARAPGVRVARRTTSCHRASRGGGRSAPRRVRAADARVDVGSARRSMRADKERRMRRAARPYSQIARDVGLVALADGWATSGAGTTAGATPGRAAAGQARRPADRDRRWAKQKREGR